MLPGSVLPASLPCRPGGQGRQTSFTGRQPQLSEKQLDTSGVAGIGCLHDAPTGWMLLSSS